MKNTKKKTTNDTALDEALRENMRPILFLTFIACLNHFERSWAEGANAIKMSTPDGRLRGNVGNMLADWFSDVFVFIPKLKEFTKKYGKQELEVIGKWLHNLGHSDDRKLLEEKIIVMDIIAQLIVRYLGSDESNKKLDEALKEKQKKGKTDDKEN